MNLDTFSPSATADGIIGLQKNLSQHEESQTVGQNKSIAEGCQIRVVSQMEFLPWDNPDNIVSAEVEHITYRMKDTILVLLFLLGGPGNIINMVVFYKQGLKDRVNLCLFSLSLADEIYLITAMFHHAEQFHMQFYTDDKFGPLYAFLSDHNMMGFFGSLYVSIILSGIIACERCMCIVSPLKFHTLLRTRTMAIIISIIYIVIVGLYFVISKFRSGCMYDPETGIVSEGLVIGEFYKDNKELVDYIESFLYGAGLPGAVMILVITTTTITTIKLRQIVKWRAGTTSAVSESEVALTKMLIGSSILFIICVFPFALSRFSWLFLPEMNSGRRNQNFYLSSFWINKILTYINSSFNICVYYTMGSRYRETFWALFSRKAGKEKGQENQPQA